MAKTITTKIVIDGVLTSRLKKAFDKLEKNNEGLITAYDKAAEKGKELQKTLVRAFAAIATATIAATEATRDYRKDLAKMYNNAELAGVSQKEAWGGLEELYSMSGEFDSANEAMSNLLATGYKGKDLEKIIEAVNGATIKWQDTVTQESLADAINETVMSGKSMGQFDEILSRSGVRIEEFNDGLLNCNGLAERQQYVLNWLAKSGLTEVNKKYQEQNKSITEAYKAELELKNATAEYGEAIEPVLSVLKRFGAGGLGYIAEKMKGIDTAKLQTSLQKVGEIGKEAFDKLWEALERVDWDQFLNSCVAVLELLTNIFTFVVNNWGLISTTILTVVAAMNALKLATLVYKGVTMATAIIEGIRMASLDMLTGGTKKQAFATFLATTAQNGLNLAFLASPITWIVLGIGLIVGAFVLLWTKCEGFRNFWKKLWQGIKDVAKAAIDGIKKAFDKIKGIFDGIKSIFTGGDKTITVKADAAKNATGGTYSSPLLTWVAEKGDTETIVPHNSKPRSQALAIEALRGTGLTSSVVNSSNTTNGGSTFVFSPTIYVTGGGNDVQGIIDDATNRFKAQMEEFLKSQGRLAY